MSRGDWDGTLGRMRICVTKGCLVFPRYVDTIRKLNVCREDYPIRNNWYEFLPVVGDQCRGTEYNLTVVGKTTTHTPIRQNVERLIRVYPVCRSDIGKNVVIFGEDENGNPLKTRAVDGTWSEGITLTIDSPYASTSTYVSSITRVIKDKTDCQIRLYAYDAVNDLLEDVALYEPSETLPEYDLCKLTMPCDCSTVRSVDVLFKFRYIPAQVDNDLVLINNLPALKDMMMSIKLKEAGDFSGSRQYEAESIRELNSQLANKNPDDVFPARMNTFNSTGITRRRLF